MSKRLDRTDRDILAFRPNIRYIEPDQQPGEIDPITPDSTQLETIQAERARLKQLAKAINALATATQAKADEKAKGMAIKLDPKVDATVIAAMKRMYPDDDPTQITYDQYRECKERMIDKGRELGQKVLTTEEDVLAAAASMNRETAAQMGGYGTTDARDGGLRPELDTKAQIIEPLDMDEFQDFLIRILVNFIWKNFIRPILPLPPGIGLMMVPEQIASYPNGMTTGDLVSMGIPILGEKKKKQEEPEVPTEVEI